VRRRAVRRTNAYARQLRRSTATRRAAYIDRAIRNADRRAVAQINENNRKLRREKTALTQAQADRLVRDNARFVSRVKRIAAQRAAARYDSTINRRISRYRARQLRNTGQRGFVAPFSFSYYGLYEDQLRPLEIAFGVPLTRSGQPVRFEDLTDADQVRLARQIGERTNQTQPNPAVVAQRGATTAPGSNTTRTTNVNSDQPRTTATTATTTPARPMPIYDIDPGTVIPAGIEGLPAQDRNRETIYTGPNCVFPSTLTITNGSYPLTRRVFVYTTQQALRRSEVKEFLNYYVDQAQSLARANDLIPITNIQEQANKAIIAGRPVPREEPITGREAPVTTEQVVTPPGQSATTTVVGGGDDFDEQPPTVTDLNQTTVQNTTTAPDPGAPRANPGGIPGVSSVGSTG
jgi:hypothetical protein